MCSERFNAKAVAPETGENVVNPTMCMIIRLVSDKTYEPCEESNR